MTLEANIWKYLFYYGGWNIACAAVLHLLHAKTGFHIGAATGLVTSIAPVFMVVQTFIVQERRVMTRAERHRFVRAAAVLNALLSAFYIYFVSKMTGFGGIIAYLADGPAAVRFLSAVAAFAASWFAIDRCLRAFTELTLKSRQKP